MKGLTVPDIVRVTARWEGFPGGPGYSNFYGNADTDAAAAAQTMATRIRAFFAGMVGWLPADVDVTVLPVYAVLSDATGEQTSEGTVASPPAVVAGVGAGGYSGNSGVAVNWNTTAFVAGKRLKGRTYLVPMGPIYQDNGTIADAIVTELQGLAEDLIGDATLFVVWHRPVGGAGGSAAEIETATIRDRAAHLRSRSV